LGRFSFFSFSTLYVCALKKAGASLEVEERTGVGVVWRRFFGDAAEKRNSDARAQRTTLQLAKKIFSRQEMFSATWHSPSNHHDTKTTATDHQEPNRTAERRRTPTERAKDQGRRLS
jgi:hypothetical protein